MYTGKALCQVENAPSRCAHAAGGVSKTLPYRKALYTEKMCVEAFAEHTKCK